MSGFIADAMGLHFPRERWSDLQRGLAGAAKEFGFDDVASCSDWLLSAPVTKAQLQILASHLTIGETYFFREKKTFAVLRDSILPKLIQSRRGREQRLRLWSAACCTGEEAYSLAVVLRQLLPDLADWQVTILATDINARFLQKAVAGSYSEWSFRDAPLGFKESYFSRSGDGRYVVLPEIKEMVTFAHLNLVEDVYPSLTTDTNAMDLIFCRNVLMYFTPSQTKRVIGKMHHALINGAWLAVSPSEVSQELFPQFVTRNYPGVIFYQKDDAKVRGGRARSPAPLGEIVELFAPALEAPLPCVPPPAGVPLHPPPAPPRDLPVEPDVTLALATSLYEQGLYSEAADTLLASFSRHAPEPQAFSLLARALANQGNLVDARLWCDRWVAAEKLDYAGHYLRAVVLLEQGNPDEARTALQRAIYLRQDFVLAHFALGNLARSRNKSDEADRHFRNALELLAHRQPDDPLPESDGLTAGRLIETITALTALEPAQ